jgi:hypothetical protein
LGQLHLLLHDAGVQGMCDIYTSLYCSAIGIAAAEAAAWVQQRPSPAALQVPLFLT